ncbi:18710_t:CDS:2, partial [Gigaspora margarita]
EQDQALQQLKNEWAFNKYWRDQICNDIPDFLAKLKLYLQNQGVDPADNAGGPPTGRDIAIGKVLEINEPEQQVSDMYNDYEKELEKALFTGIQLVSEMIGHYNNLQAQYNNLLTELVPLIQIANTSSS